MAGSHSRFAPSAAPRVVRCPASLLLNETMPDTQSIDAAHGTAAHFIADLCLTMQTRALVFFDETITVDKDGVCMFIYTDDLEAAAEAGNFLVFPVDQEMVEAVQEHVDWCNDLAGEKFTERRVDVSRWCPKTDEHGNPVPPQSGTADHAACEPGRLTITDLKYGKGVQVFAEDNEQAIQYALGFIDEWDWLYDFDEVVIRISQPRLDHKDVWVTNKQALFYAGQRTLAQYERALQPDPPFHPGETQCKFCKVAGTCRALAEHTTTVRALAFDDISEDFDTPDPRLLTADELAEAWKMRKLFNLRFDAIEREMLKTLEQGIALPGVKLVEARTYRDWISPDAAVADLEFAGVPHDKLFKTSMISPAQAEKLLPKVDWDIVSTLVHKPRGGPTIADAADKRPSYEAVASARIDESFSDLDS